MGIVYEAEQISLGRKVALKILPLAAALDPRRRQRFLLEARAAASLHHSHIVPVHAVGTESGVPYYVMEFIDGRTLAQVLQELHGRNGRTPVDDLPATSAGPRALESTIDENPIRSFSAETKTEPGASLGLTYRTRGHIRAVAEYGRQAAGALAYAHRQGIVHRDIKSANLMLDGEGHLWITDFGLARIDGECGMTLTGDLVGTLRYMSPEQALGKRQMVDGRTDVYSLGATMYELLALRPVFEGIDRPELLRRIAQDEPTSLRKWNPAVPRDLETIVRKALAKEPAERYQTAHDLSEDLQKYLTDRPIAARGPTLASRTARWSRRNRLKIAGGVCALAVLILTASLGAWRHGLWKQDKDRLLQAEASRADENEREARRHHREAALLRYADRVDRASRSIEQGRLQEAGIILEDVAPVDGFDPREFAYRYLWRRAHPIVAIPDPDGRLGPCTHVSPDGTMLATHTESGPVYLLDSVTGRCKATIESWAPGWAHPTISPDNRLVVRHHAIGSGPNGWLGQCWDAATGRLLAEFQNETEGMLFALHPMAGGRLVTEELVRDGIYGTFLWEPAADSLRPRLLARLSDTTGSVFNHVSPDGFVFGSWSMREGGRVTYAFHDTRTGKQIQTVTRAPGASEPGQFACAWVAGGNTLVDLEESGHVTFWDIKTAIPIARYDVGRLPDWRYTTVSPDARTIAEILPDLKVVELWDKQRGWTHKLAIPADAESPGASRLLFLQDGRSLAVSARSPIGEWSPPIVYDVATGRTLATYQESIQSPSENPFYAWVPGRALLLNQMPVSKLWWIDAAVGFDALAGHSDEAWAMGFSSDGRLLATGSDDTEESQTLKLWDTATGQLLRGWGAHPATTSAVAFQPGGTILASASLGPDQNLRLWEAETGALLATLKGHTDRVRALAFRPDGRVLASAGSDRQIRLWDVSSRRSLGVLTGHTEAIRQLAFAPDGCRLASVGNDCTVRLWETDRAESIQTWTGDAKIAAVAFSPDGTILAWAQEDGVIQRWELRQTRLLRPLRDVFAELRCLAFAPDGHTLASGGKSGEIHLWDPDSGQELLTLPGPASQANALAFAPNGASLAVCWHDGTVRLFRAR
jgi:WD40 repeat protein/serine/threonine protein kinase